MSEKLLTSYTCKLSEAQGEALRAWLRAHHWEFREVPYARFAAEGDKVNVVFYESRKLVVQGKATREFVEFVLEPGDHQGSAPGLRGLVKSRAHAAPHWCG